MLSKKQENTRLKHFYDPKTFIEYSNDMDDIDKNIKEYNPNKQRKILLISDDMIAYIFSNESLNLVVIELFIRGRKLNISLVLF